jgi:hypothetical protein
MDECARELNWAGGKHVFNLNEKRTRLILQQRGLPGQFGNTPAACLKRFEDGVYGIEDVERVLELGLAGGGMPAREVERLLNDHVRLKPLGPNAVVAVEILGALFVGGAANGA